jgi:hypothetical protein
MSKYIFITRDGAPLPIADRLQDEGNEVVVGMTEDDEESKGRPAKNECRLSLYDGILEKRKANEVLGWMRGLKDKDEWFVMFDYGDLWPYSERVLEMGFKKGVFPTEDGYKLEQDRKAGKAFAEKNYPLLMVAPVQQFDKVDDAIKYLETDKDKIYVLKSEGSNAETVVPMTEDVDLAKKQIVGALRSEAKDYEKEGFTLEERIKKPIEISPVMVFWNGKPLFSLIELENKNFGSGNIGRLTGGCQNLTIRTRLDAEINKMAFPPIIYEMAKKQPGIGIYDSGLLYDGSEFFFTEFCSQRWGWDGIFSEIAMCADDDGKFAASTHFDAISQGISPLAHNFGVSVRLFQTEPDSKRPDVYQDGYAMDWHDKFNDQLWFYCMKKNQVGKPPQDQFVSVGYKKDLGVATGSGRTIDAAINGAYAAAEGFAMTGVYYRPKFDFTSRAYPTSIMNRLEYLRTSNLL